MAKGKAKTEEDMVSVKDLLAQAEDKLVKEFKDARKNLPDRKLNERQELFCYLYANDREFFGNGVQAYIESYQPDRTKKNWYNVARACTSQLLTNINILARINDYLENMYLNDEFVDKQLALLIHQNADFKTKISAIKEYNELKQRIKRKLALEGPDGKPLTVSVIEFVGDNGPARTEENTNQVS